MIMIYHIQAEDWSEAHKVIVEELAPSAILSQVGSFILLPKLKGSQEAKYNQ